MLFKKKNLLISVYFRENSFYIMLGCGVRKVSLLTWCLSAMTSSGPCPLGAKTRVYQLWRCYHFGQIVVSLGKRPLSNISALYLLLDDNGKLPVLFIYNCCRPVKREGFSGGSVVESLLAKVGATGDTSVSELGRSPGGGNNNPLQYSCLENATDRGAWRATVHGVTKSWTGLSTHKSNASRDKMYKPLASYCGREGLYCR